MLNIGRTDESVMSTRRGTFHGFLPWLVVVALMLGAPSAFAAGQVENTEAERERIDELVAEYADEAFDDEEEREEFHRIVVGELSERLVDVWGLEVALRAFDVDTGESARELADFVVGSVDRIETRLRRGMPAHEAAAISRSQERARIPEHVTAAERHRERAHELRRRAADRARRERPDIPRDGLDDDVPDRP